eukprot:CAMPEP_0196753892 /NCGR_PEP_ID=MMETSP1091-20130531/92109_1 /TAXON_ID=302021 /ORGANISM="Rhodomonas sp., Strain CCMP768" /LENGTH=157 /DNA_ID=CAMNT_0042102069 /DNA_START=1 /DNA_END=471 /DNA_ORIENTATION=-
MECLVSAPLAVQMRKDCHWPLCIVLTLGCLPMIPVGTGILQLTMDSTHGNLALQLKHVFGVTLLLVVVMQVCVELFQNRHKPSADKTPSSELETGQTEDPDSSLLQNAELQTQVGANAPGLSSSESDLKPCSQEVEMAVVDLESHTPNDDHHLTANG